MYIGVDLGGTNIAVGLVDEEGKIIHKESTPTLAQRHYTEIIKDMAELSLKVVKDAGYKLKDVKAVGIGSPGTPNNEKGILVYTNNLNFNNVPMREEMQKYINLPVFIENDANCAALAEAIAGAGKKAKVCVAITLGTGVGGGIVIDKKIYSGFNYAASELGHIVLQLDGEPCTCGRNGCWEAYASATALIRQTRKAAEDHPESMLYTSVNGDLENISGRTAFDAAKAGDPVGAEVVKDYIRYVAEGIINTVNALQPEVLVIGGGICKEGPYLLNPLTEYIEKFVYSKNVPQTEIKIALLGNDAGIIGAAMLGK